MSVITVNTTTRSSKNWFDVVPTEGQDANNLTVSKDSIPIPCRSDGTNPVFTGASTKAYVYQGATDETNTWSITLYSTTGVSVSVSNDTFTVTNITGDTGSFTIRAAKSTYANLYKTVTVYKAKEGQVGPPAASNFVYVGYADDSEGTGFTTTFSNSKEYWALKMSATQILVPTASDFTGLWRPFNQYPTTSSYKETAYFSTDKAQWSANAMSSSMGPHVYYHKGTYSRIYYALYDYHRNASNLTRTDHVNKTWVGYYDIDTKSFSALTGIDHVYPISTDLHDVSSLIVSDDGHIIIFKETLRGNGLPTDSNASHNSPIEIWRSDVAEDISNFTQITTLTYSPTYEGFAYPNAMKGVNQGEIFLFLRGNKGVDHSNLCAVKSTDNGATWYGLDGVQNRPYQIASCDNIAGVGLDWYFYLRFQDGGLRTNGMSIYAGLNEGPNGTSPDGTAVASRYKYLIYMHSMDGVTWTNVHGQFDKAGSFSKNTVTSGYITATEMKNNFVVTSVATTPYLSLLDYHLGSDSNGVPHFFYSTFLRYASSVTPDYIGRDRREADYIKYYDTVTGDWVTNVVSGFNKNSQDPDYAKLSALSVQTGMVVYGDGTIDILYNTINTKTDFYASTSPIMTSAGCLVGGIFKVNTVNPAGNFGEGVIAGDYYYHTNASRIIDANNTLIPLTREIQFFRTRDKGLTWSEIREPLNFGEKIYASVQPGVGLTPCYLDNGVVAFLTAYPKPLPGTNILDHSDWMLVWDKIKSF